MSEPILEVNYYVKSPATVNVSGSKRLKTQSIELRPGWNIISTYIDLTTLTSNSTGGGSTDILLIFAGLQNDSVIKDYSANIAIPKYSFNEIGNWTDSVNNLGQYIGLQVLNDSTTTVTISLEGNLNYTDSSNIQYGASFTTPSLWSLIPWVFPYRCNVANVFSEYKEIQIIVDEKGRSYKPSTGFNSIGNLIPGRGYYIRSVNPISLVFNSTKYKRGGYPNYKIDHVSSIDFPQTATDSYFNLVLNKGVILAFMKGLPLDEASTLIYFKTLDNFGLMASKDIKSYINRHGYRKSFEDFGSKESLTYILKSGNDIPKINFDKFLSDWTDVQHSLRFMDEYYLSITNDSDVVVAESSKWSSSKVTEGEVECRCSVSSLNNIIVGDIFYVYLNNNNKKYKMTLVYDLPNSIPPTNPGVIYDRGFLSVSKVTITEVFNSIELKA